VAILRYSRFGANLLDITQPTPDSLGGTTRIALCDWGGSRLRAFLQVEGEIVARREGMGISALRGSAMGALRDTLRPWSETNFDQIVMCGMGGSRNGIVEVPYVPMPAGLPEWASHALEHQADDFAILIAAGISGANAAGAPEVMRGEETQIFGAMKCDAALARGRHTLLLPGTHSKWVQITDGRITAMQTYITGELFAVLRDHSSLLRAGDSRESADGGFAAGLARARESGLSSSLFETRAAQLTLGRPQGWGRDFLSGLLIGDEVAAALRGSALTSVVLIGEGALAALYGEALFAQGVAFQCLDADRCVVAGLRALLAQHGRGD
jgi:2-dehydro-3-deoxygalactonokinase